MRLIKFLQFITYPLVIFETLRFKFLKYDYRDEKQSIFEVAHDIELRKQIEKLF